jgi:tRNA threonylcarbamoyladenosine biosynthesis protein TsaE
MNAEVAQSRSVVETERLGESLAPYLRIGDVVGLTGPLGAGKTRFVTGLARGLDAKTRVRSPSFTLVNEYRGRIPLFHLDLYRLAPRELEGVGIEDAAEQGAVVVEWADRLPGAWLAQALVIELATAGPEAGPEARTLHARAQGARALELLAAWRAGAGLAMRVAEGRGA